MKILDELLKSSPSSIIDLLMADFSSIGGTDILRFFSGTSEGGSNIVWNSNTYTAYPLELSGLEINGAGQLPTPHLKLANIGGYVSELNVNYSDLLGLKITRIRTMAKYLDAINFTNGNPTADPEASFPPEVFYIDRKVSENNILVEYELVSALDISSIKLPRRLIIQNMCQWRYKHADGNCGYIPAEHNNRMFTEFGVATSNPDLDICGKKLSDCKIRFGANATLNYGGFPGAGLYK